MPIASDPPAHTVDGAADRLAAQTAECAVLYQRLRRAEDAHVVASDTYLAAKKAYDLAHLRAVEMLDDAISEALEG